MTKGGASGYRLGAGMTKGGASGYRLGGRYDKGWCVWIPARGPV